MLPATQRQVWSGNWTLRRRIQVKPPFYLSDEEIKNDIEKEIWWSLYVQLDQVNVPVNFGGVMLLLGAIIPPATPRDRIVIESEAATPPGTQEPSAAEIAVGFFFWIFILGLLALALVRIFG